MGSLKLWVLALLVVSVHSMTVEVTKGTVTFWLLNCPEPYCENVNLFEHTDVVAPASFIIDIPEKPNLYLYVRCLGNTEECTLHYTTMIWDKTVTVPPTEAMTFPAANTRDTLRAVVTPTFYNSESKPVLMTVTFTNNHGLAEATNLSKGDLTVINGVLEGEVRKSAANTYEFTVRPNAAKLSFAVLIAQSVQAVRGLKLLSGLVNTCNYDGTAPTVTNTNYIRDVNDDVNEKVITVTFSEPVTATIDSQPNNVVTDVSIVPGTLNSYAITVKGDGIAHVTFTDRAGNTLTFTQAIVFNPNSDMVLTYNSANATLPRNGFIELSYNHNVQAGALAVLIVRGKDSTQQVPVVDGKLLMVRDNRVFVHLSELTLTDGSYTLEIPAGSFISATGRKCTAESLSFRVRDQKCNVGFVVDGMDAATCKCYSILNKCQCACGKTYFSRDYTK